jgi:hypothetical protein
MPQIYKSRPHKIIKVSSKQARKLTSDPKFRARMAKVNAIPIITKYDVPYLGGYSSDGKRVYLDRHLKTKMDGHDISRFIRVHEVAEKALLDLFNLDYQQAHHIALHVEWEAVRSAGINWRKYSKFLDPYIKKVSGDLQKVPPDLDLTPYKDERDKKVLSALMPKTKLTRLDEIRLSLQYHKELNPKLRNNFELKTEVRDRLLYIGQLWADYAKIPKEIVQDVIMTGGNANYNYTSKSDIDVHLIVDRSKIGISKQFLDDYLQDKKTLWSIKNTIKIYGFPIELYAQDSHDRYPENQGVFSLLNNRWIQMPKHLTLNFAKDPFLKKKVEAFIDQIDTMIKNQMDVTAFKELRLKLKNMRDSSIQKGGEFSQENLIFKELRNRGYLDRINNYIRKKRELELSLEIKSVITQ